MSIERFILLKYLHDRLNSGFKKAVWINQLIEGIEFFCHSKCVNWTACSVEMSTWQTTFCIHKRLCEWMISLNEVNFLPFHVCQSDGLFCWNIKIIDSLLISKQTVWINHLIGWIDFVVIPYSNWTKYYFEIFTL